MQIIRKQSKGDAKGIELKFKEERDHKRYCRGKYECIAFSRISKKLVQMSDKMVRKPLSIL